MDMIGSNITMNVSNETTMGAVGPSRAAMYIGASIMLIALILGLFGNFLVMIVIIRRKDIANIIHLFVVSLCINDIINLGINNTMVTSSYLIGKWPTGLLGCELSTHFTVILMGSSLWHTALIAIHRLVVVVFNNFYKKISKKGYTIFLLVFCRVVPLLFLCQPSLGHMAYYEPKLIRCIVKKNYGPFTLLVSIFLMMIPSFILIVCYIAIFIKVHQSSQAFRANRQKEWLKREIQITKMFGIVFLLIMIGYIPYGIVRAIDKTLSYDANFYVAITVFFAVANCFNPVVYGVMDRQIRKACFEALNIRRRNEGEDSPEFQNKETMTNHTRMSIDMEDSPAIPLKSKMKENDE
ncbi:melatonin receptor type 1A-like [Mya arenaria]|uniref:melatonin receptor type 1A-like n=1 Tax=Mya arenaria TaxID=6604 RepID=UPI0022E865F0|nr:melatonin receptor type 1A-like [Mya arenaria]